MRRIRLIARLDIKGPNLIKGIHLEGLRVIGSPNEYALRYYMEGADELIYMDCVASLYGRNSLGDIVKSAAEDVFIPMTVGGGIRSAWGSRGWVGRRQAERRSDRRRACLRACRSSRNRTRHRSAGSAQVGGGI